MFIKSSADTVLKYHKGADCIEIKPNTVTCIDDGLITEKELKDCYGTRVHVLTEKEVNNIVEEISDVAEEKTEEAPVEEPKEEKIEEPKEEAPVEEPKEEKIEEPKEIKKEAKATKKDNKKNNKK